MNFKSIKIIEIFTEYAAPDLYDFLKCLTYENGHYDILWGIDESLHAVLAMGARGGLGSTYNYTAPLYYHLIEAFDSGKVDKARDRFASAENEKV